MPADLLRHNDVSIFSSLVFSFGKGWRWVFRCKVRVNKSGNQIHTHYLYWLRFRIHHFNMFSWPRLSGACYKRGNHKGWQKKRKYQFLYFSDRKIWLYMRKLDSTQCNTILRSGSIQPFDLIWALVYRYQLGNFLLDDLA